MSVNTHRNNINVMAPNTAKCFMIVLPLKDFKMEDFPVDGVKYILGQQERSEESFEHWQLMVMYNNSRSLNAIKKIWKVNTVEITKDSKAAAIYVTKEATRIPGTEIYRYGAVPVSKDPDTHDSKVDQLCRELMKATDRADAILIARDRMPAKWIFQQKALMAFINNKFDNTFVHDYTPEMFNRNLIRLDDCLTHIFYGPTNMGKTAFALAHFKNPVLISDRSDFGKVDPLTTDGIVIDDIHFKRWNPSNVLHLVDVKYNRTINIKYGSAFLKKGLKRIITINDISDFWPIDCNEATNEAINRRIKLHYFSNPLYNVK